MSSEELWLRRGVVFASALVYWAGVLIHARRVRKRIGRSPNVRPRGRRERLLWAGWMVVGAVWFGQPFLVVGRLGGVWVELWPGLSHVVALVIGLVLVAAGYSATLWCYSAMGNTWRMGVNRREKIALVTRGPYRVVRHPIYLFQAVMLVGVGFLLPTLLSLGIIVIHLLCVVMKASDEEAYLLSVHGNEYREYLSRTGRLLPRLRRPTISG